MTSSNLPIRCRLLLSTCLLFLALNTLADEANWQIVETEFEPFEQLFLTDMDCQPSTPQVYLYDSAESRFLTTEQALSFLPAVGELYRADIPACEKRISRQVLADRVNVEIEADSGIVLLGFDLPGFDLMGSGADALYSERHIELRNTRLAIGAEMDVEQTRWIKIALPENPGPPAD